MVTEKLKRFKIDGNVVDISCEGKKIYFNGELMNPKIFKRNGKKLYVCYYKKMYYIHRLIAQGWVANPNNYKYVGFNNYNTLTTHYTNLQWHEKQINARISKIN